MLLKVVMYLAGYPLLLFVIWSGETLSKDVDNYVAYTLEVEHSFDGGMHFSKRAVIQFDGLKQSSTINIQQFDLSDHDQQNLVGLADSGGYYMLRAQSSLQNNDDKEATGIDQTVVSTFVKACLLVESDLRDTIVLHGDGQGNIIGFSVETAVKECTSSHYNKANLMSEFFTEVLLDNGVTGPAPEVQKYLHKLEEEKKKAAMNKDQDNRSFIQKYWFHLLIGFLVFTFMNAASAQNSGGGAGGGAGSGQ